MQQTKEISNYEEFIIKIEEYIKDYKEKDIIEKAYHYALKHHQGIKRLTGEEYITHPLNVAYILTDYKVDYQTLTAALLHETINNGTGSIEEIDNIFGCDISGIVNTVTTLNKLKLTDDTEGSYIHMRKIIVGLSEDVRVLLIKLADRLHNLRTANVLSDKKQKYKAYETLNVFIPIAHRLGINKIKSELEDHCLRYLKPDVYNDILEKLEKTRIEMNKSLLEMQNQISELLNDHNIKFEVYGRVKSIHSIYTKLSTGRSFNDIYDILALRVLVDEESDCYSVIGLLHSKFRFIPKRFKDFISMAKENMYQSLHTTVFGVDNFQYEIQVRTYEMHEIAESGIASHWSYKEKSRTGSQAMMEQRLEMFRNLIESNENESSNESFVETIKEEFLNDSIYVFTPKGDVVELPQKSTPIDFAYRIHSGVGETCVGALVNDNIVSLSHELEDGDIVKIQTNKNSTPNNDWLNFVKTTQAKNKIKAYFSKKHRILYEEKGKELIDKELKRRKLSINETLSDENLNKIIMDLKLKDIDDLYLSVGSLRYTPSYIINLISDDKSNVKEILVDKIMKKQESLNLDNSDVLVEGIDSVKVNLAKCCKPIIGDDIVGYITKGSGVSIHIKDCSNLTDKEERLINVSWNKNTTNEYITDVIIETTRDDNPLLDIIAVTSPKNINIVKFYIIKDGIYNNLRLSLKIKNKEDLDIIMKEIKKLSFVKNIERV